MATLKDNLSKWFWDETTDWMHSSSCTKNTKWRVLPLADPGFGQGGAPEIFSEIFADVAKRSRTSKVSQYWPGSRARLRALEALAF